MMNKSNQVFGLSLEKRPLSVIEFASDQVGKKDTFLLFNQTLIDVSCMNTLKLGSAMTMAPFRYTEEP